MGGRRTPPYTLLESLRLLWDQLLLGLLQRAVHGSDYHCLNLVLSRSTILDPPLGAIPLSTTTCPSFTGQRKILKCNNRPVNSWTPEMWLPQYSGHFEESQNGLYKYMFSWSYPSNQDTTTGPKGGLIEGVHCIHIQHLSSIVSLPLCRTLVPRGQQLTHVHKELELKETGIQVLCDLPYHISHSLRSETPPARLTFLNH